MECADAIRQIRGIRVPENAMLKRIACVCCTHRYTWEARAQRILAAVVK